MESSAIGNYVFLTAAGYKGILKGRRTPTYDSFQNSINAVHEELNNKFNDSNLQKIASELEVEYNKMYRGLQIESGQEIDTSQGVADTTDLHRIIEENLRLDYGARGKFYTGGATNELKDQFLYASYKIKEIADNAISIYQEGYTGLEKSLSIFQEAVSNALAVLNNVKGKQAESVINKLKKQEEYLSQAAKLLEATKKNIDIDSLSRDKNGNLTKAAIQKFKKAILNTREGNENFITLYNKAAEGLDTTIKNNVQGTVGEAFAEAIKAYSDYGAIRVGSEEIERIINPKTSRYSRNVEGRNIQSVDVIDYSKDKRVTKNESINIATTMRFTSKKKADASLTISYNNTPIEVSVKNIMMAEKIKGRGKNKKSIIGTSSGQDISLVDRTRFYYLIQNEDKHGKFVTHWMNVTQKFPSKSTLKEFLKKRGKYSEDGGKAAWSLEYVQRYFSVDNRAFAAAKKKAHETMKQLLFWKALTGEGLVGKKLQPTIGANLFLIMDATGRYGVKVLTMQDVYKKCIAGDIDKFVKIQGYENFTDQSLEKPWGSAYEADDLIDGIISKDMSVTRINRMIALMKAAHIKVFLRGSAFNFNDY